MFLAWMFGPFFVAMGLAFCVESYSKQQTIQTAIETGLVQDDKGHWVLPKPIRFAADEAAIFEHEAGPLHYHRGSE